MCVTQVLAGSYPIAQVREPLAVLRYLAEHCTPPLHIHYKLKRPRHSDAMGEAQVRPWLRKMGLSVYNGS